MAYYYCLSRNFRTFSTRCNSLFHRLTSAADREDSHTVESNRPVPSLRPRTLSTSPLYFQEEESPFNDAPEPEARPFSDIPKTKTLLGLNVEVMKNPIQIPAYFEKQVKMLGPIVHLVGVPNLPNMLLVVDPKDAERVYRTGDLGYPKRFPLIEWEDVLKELNLPFSMLFENGENWHDQRMPVSKFIMMPRKVAEYHVPFNAVTCDLIDLIRKQRGEDDLFLDVTSSLKKWSLESVSLFVLGKRLGCLEEEMPPECKEFVDCMDIFNETTNSLLLGLPFHKIWPTKKWKTLVNSFRVTYNFSRSRVKEKIEEIKESDRESGEVDAILGMDFLTYMIYSGKMSAEMIATNAINLMGAGVETTSLTMAGCLYSLSRNPDVQDKLRQEIKRVVGSEAIVTPSHIHEMHYLRDCIKETQRLYPIAPNNSRILSEDVVLSGYNVPAGTVILLSTIVCGRLPHLFPEPERFMPERWSKGNAEPPNAFSSLPFGFGRRMCVGRRVAELEMHILLAQMIKNFKIEYRDDKPIEFVAKLLYGPGRQMDLTFIDI